MWVKQCVDAADKLLLHTVFQGLLASREVKLRYAGQGHLQQGTTKHMTITHES